MKTFKELLTEAIKHSPEDLRLLRKGMRDELKAINEYEEHAEAAKHPLVKKLFLEIAMEEKIHMSEFEEMLEELDPDYEEAEEQAEDEVEDL